MEISQARLDAFHRERAHKGSWVRAQVLIGFDGVPSWLPPDLPWTNDGGRIYFWLEGDSGARDEVRAALNFLMAAQKPPKKRQR